MASPRIDARKKLSAAEIAGLAATALPFGVIWAEQDIDTVIAKADNIVTHAYLLLLKRYRNSLTESNPIYSNKNISVVTEILEHDVQNLLHDLHSHVKTQAELISLHAAVMNLQGVIHRDLKMFDSAQSLFEADLSVQDLHPLAKASLLHNLAFTLSVKGEYQAAMVRQEEAIEHLEKIALDDSPILQHLAANIYDLMAVLFAKVGRDHKAKFEFEASQKAFEKVTPMFSKAIKLWASNNIIVNHQALHLTKTGSHADCAAAQAVLASFLPEAQEKNRFVTLFYQADASIKLAGFARDQKNFADLPGLIRDAEANLALAKAAIETYSDQNYVSKAKARLLYLDADLAYVNVEYEKITGLKEQAEDMRKDVVENGEGKKDKFLLKFPPASGPFDVYRLFRQPVKRMLRMIPLAAVEAESNVKLTR